MAKTFNVQCNLLNHTTNDTRVHGVGQGRHAIVTTANRIQADRTFRSAGTISQMQFQIDTNGTTTGTAVSTLQINGSDVTVTANVPFGEVGLFKDFTNDDAVAAGDELAWEWVANGTQDVEEWMRGWTFDATSNRVAFYGGTSNAVSLTHASVMRFMPLAVCNINSTEATVQAKMSVAGTFKNGFAYVSANSRTTDSTFSIEKNGSTQTLAITYGSGATGVIEDTSNTVAVSVDDLVCWGSNHGTGTEALVIQSLTVEMETTGNSWMVINQTHNAPNVAAGATQNHALGGYLNSLPPDEGSTQFEVPFDCVASDLRVYVPSNATTSASTCKLRVDGANSALSATIDAVTDNSWWEDTTNEVSLSAGDLINFQFVNGGGGAFSVSAISMLLTESTGTTYQETYNETVTLVDTILKATTRTLTDVITGVDTILKETQRTLSDVVTLVDTFLGEKFILAVYEETITLVDTLTRSLTRTLEDAVTLVDDIVRSIVRTVTETITLDDVLTAAKLTIKELLEELPLVDTLTRSITRTLDDTLTLVDTITRSIQRTLTDVATLVDTVVRSVSRELSDALTLVDTVIKATTRTLTDTLPLTDTFESVKSLFRTLEETISLTDLFEYVGGAVTNIYGRLMYPRKSSQPYKRKEEDYRD